MKKIARHDVLFGVTVILLSLTCLSPALAQPAAPGAEAPEGRTITGVGVATIERPANLLRMQVDLTAEGADVREAVTKLRAAEAAARKKLAGLGAAEKSIMSSPVRDVAGAKNPRQAQMELIVRQQRGLAAGGAKKPATAPAPSVTAGLTLTAEWPLSGSGDELLVSAAELTRKIRDADVGGKKDTGKNLTPEQQEEQEEQQGIAEQAAAMSGEMTGAGAAAPGEPRFVYVARLSDDEQQKAAADAFAKAKAQAERLAKAAGAARGELHQLSSQRTIVGADQQNQNEYAAMVYSMMSGGRTGATAGADDDNEAVGTQPTNVTVKITVTASFGIR